MLPTRYDIRFRCRAEAECSEGRVDVLKGSVEAIVLDEPSIVDLPLLAWLLRSIDA